MFYALNCVFEENAAYEAIVKSVVYVKPKWFPGKIGVNQMGAVGLYKTGYKSSCHCHVLPVKNLVNAIDHASGIFLYLRPVL